MNDLIPVLAATVAPAVLILAAAYPLRPQTGRHTAGMVAKRAAGWSPFDARTRSAIAHYAGKQREPYKPEQDDDVIWSAVPKRATDRDLTGVFPVVAVA